MSHVPQIRDLIMKRRQLMASVGLTAATAVVVGHKAAANPYRASPPSTWDRIALTRKLRVGAALLEPWYFKDILHSGAPGSVTVGTDMWRGICPVLAADLARTLEVNLEIVETTWGNAVTGLQVEQYDVMFMLESTPRRALAVDFLPVPMLWYPLGVLADESISIARWSDLNNNRYSLAVALGSNSDEYVTSVAPRANILRFRSSAEIIAAFQSGRVNGGVISAMAADIARVHIGTGKTILPMPVLSVPGGVAVRKEQDNRWKEFLTAFVTRYYNTGKMEEIYNTFLRYRGVNADTAVSLNRQDWGIKQ